MCLLFILFWKVVYSSFNLLLMSEDMHRMLRFNNILQQYFIGPQFNFRICISLIWTTVSMVLFGLMKYFPCLDIFYFLNVSIIKHGHSKTKITRS